MLTTWDPFRDVERLFEVDPRSRSIPAPFDAVRTADERGVRATDKAWVRAGLAQCYARLEAMRLINLRIAADLERERMDVALASTTKVYGSESSIEILRLLSNIVGANALVHDGSPASLLHGEL